MQYAHLEALAIGVEDLEVEFDRFHVEGNVLFRFPSHQFPCLRVLDAFDRDLLDDDIASADGGDDVFRLDARGFDGLSNGFHHHAVVHDFTVNNRGVMKRGDDDLGEDRSGAAVIDHDCLDESRTNIDAYCGLLSAEELHCSASLRVW
jgi:hypothetical protein